MDNQDSTLLFEYLRSILYDPKVKSLDLEKLSPDFKKLGMGLQYLEKAVKEMKNYAADLSTGLLSEIPPSRENPLCENLKNIHANLKHLTWQAKQVARGDYSQNVAYLGEFSEAFNTMTAQLAEREEALKREAQRQMEQKAALESYNNLLTELISRSKEKILIVSLENEDFLYSSLSKDDLAEKLYRKLHGRFLTLMKEGHFPAASATASFEWSWDMVDEENKQFYHINTGFMEWQGENAYVHLIMNITNQKMREEQLEQEAYEDALTGIGNRYYFLYQADLLLKAGINFILCYCDLDHLKYVNDNHGHACGDEYICSFVNIIQSNIRGSDIFARIGGDEFCVILTGCSMEEAHDRFGRIQKAFHEDASADYPKEFSVGLVEVTAEKKFKSIDAIISVADVAMYQQKLMHKHDEPQLNRK